MNKKSKINSTSNLMRSSELSKNKFINHFFYILRKIGGGDRFLNLCPYIEKEVSNLKNKLKRKLYLLDYGCGKMDFSIFLIKKKLIHKALCADNYELQNDIIKKNYQYVNISKNKILLQKKKFDVAIIIDVLHHIGIDQCHKELRKICNISKYVIIKDHIEYGYISRQFLRLGDWFGNFGTDINIPQKYFTEFKWQKLIEKLKLNQIKIIKNVNQHKGLFSLILKPKHQFIAVIKNNNKI
jgi:hypothetical protein